MSGSGPLGAVMRALHRPVYAARLRALTAAILPHLKEGDRVLDVGCGNGTLGRALMDHPRCPKRVVVEGLERFKRGGEPITVHAYDGVKMPMPDASYDIVITADVLHHEEDELRLLRECARVTRRLLIIKDHVVSGPLAQQRISLIDWAANAPYGVKCLFRYHTPDGWRKVRQDLDMTPAEERLAMNLYPPGVNLAFGRGLQYFVVLEKKASGDVRGTKAPRCQGTE